MICRPVAAFLGTTIQVVAAGPVDAMVELSIACMFEREHDGSGMSGGLLHLDQALGGSLASLRADGLFRARQMETILFTNLPEEISANTLLVVGLGDPDQFSPSVLERAVATAVREAIKLGLQSAAFSPDLLDAGMTTETTGVLEISMIKGLREALMGAHHMFDLGLTGSVTLQTWSFGSGSAHLDLAAIAFGSAVRGLDG